MAKMTSMQDRIYEHYRTHPGRNPKKLSRRKFKKHLKRHGRKMSSGTRRIRRGIGSNMSERDFQKFGPR